MLRPQRPRDDKPGQQRGDGGSKAAGHRTAVQLEDQHEDADLDGERQQPAVAQLPPHAVDADEDDDAVDQRADVKVSETEHVSALSRGL